MTARPVLRVGDRIQVYSPVEAPALGRVRGTVTAVRRVTADVQLDAYPEPITLVLAWDRWRQLW